MIRPTASRKSLALPTIPTRLGTEWTAFLQRVLPDESVREYLQRIIGVALLGKVIEHVLAILIGTGRNGKSTFYEAVCHALGDYAHAADPELFMLRHNAHPVGEMDLLGRRLVVVSESGEDRRLDEANVKRLTGGDPINARYMHKNPVVFTPSHLPLLITNHLPKVSDDSPAIWSRLRVIPFDVFIPEHEQDTGLADTLQAEADAVLAWSLRRLDRIPEPQARRTACRGGGHRQLPQGQRRRRPVHRGCVPPVGSGQDHGG